MSHKAASGGGLPPTRTGVVIVARRKGREYSINVPRSEIAALAAKLRQPLGGAIRAKDAMNDQSEGAQSSFLSELTSPAGPVGED